MQVFLIEESKKINFFKKIFTNIEKKEDKILLNFKCKEIPLNKKIKIAKKISKILKANNVKKIIISKDLKKDKDFINLLYSNGFDIIEGKKLFKLLINEIVEKICKKNNIKSEDARISITVNDIDNLTIKIIEDLSKKFKTVNIVTNNINYFKKIEEKLWNENGIIITVTNNKKKALAKSDIILNIDFPEEIINKYIIYDNSILINIEERVKIKKKRFNGKIINDYKIKLKKDSNMSLYLEKEEYKNFDLEDIAEIYIINYPEEIKDIIIS